MKKRLISFSVILLLVGVGIACTANQSYSAESNAAETQVVNTMDSRSEMDTLNNDECNASSSKIENAAEYLSMTEDDAITETLLDFFRVLSDSYINNDNGTLSMYFAKASDMETDEDYFLEKQIYEKALYKSADVVFEQYYNNTTIESIQRNDNTAKAIVYNLVTYTDKNGNGQDSSVGTRYDISLIKEDEDWKILKIYAQYDEFDETHYDTGFDLDELLSELGDSNLFLE